MYREVTSRLSGSETGGWLFEIPIYKEDRFFVLFGFDFLIMCLCTCGWGQRSIAASSSAALYLMCWGRVSTWSSQVHQASWPASSGTPVSSSLGLGSTSSCLYGEYFSISQATFQFFIMLGIGCKTYLCACRANVLLLSPNGVLILVWKYLEQWWT